MHMNSGSGFLGAGGGIKTIQTGTIAITAALVSATAAITAVDPNNALVLFGGFTCTNTFNRWDVTHPRLTLTSGTVVTATRGLAAASGETITVSFTVIEFIPGVLRGPVQYGTIDLAGVVTNTAAITAVTPANAGIVMLGWSTGDTTANQTEDFVSPKVVITSGTVVTATRQSFTAPAFVVSFAVFERIP